MNDSNVSNDSNDSNVLELDEQPDGRAAEVQLLLSREIEAGEFEILERVEVADVAAHAEVAAADKSKAGTPPQG